MKQTVNPTWLVGDDGRTWVSYGDETCRVSEVRDDLSFGPEIIVGVGGNAWPFRDGLCTWVDDKGQRYEVPIGEWTPVVRAGLVPRGVPFRANGEGHWLVTRPAVKQVIRNGTLVIKDATGGVLDGEECVWVTASNTKLVCRSNGIRIPALWPVGAVACSQGRTILQKADHSRMVMEDGTDCRVTVDSGKREGAPVAWHVGGVLWVGTGCTVNGKASISVRPAGEETKELLEREVAGKPGFDVVVGKDSLLVVSTPSTYDRLFVDRVAVKAAAPAKKAKRPTQDQG